MRPLRFMLRAFHRVHEPLVRHGAKTRTQPRGANRVRLAGVIRSLGVYDRRIAARTRAEQELEEHLANALTAREEVAQRIVRALDARRALRTRENLWFAREIQRQRRSRVWQRELAILARAQRDFALMLREERARQAMSEEQLALDRLEDTVVAWLNGGEDSAAS